MSQNTQFPLVKNDHMPREKFHGTPSVIAVFPLRDLLAYRLALFAALLAWSVPAAAQSMTGYPLAGVHATQACARCHTTMPYKTAPSTCGSCHVADYQKSVNPPHVASGFPTTCDTCHKFTDAAWKPASFNHSTATTFALAGLHATQACTACHKNNVYKGTPRDCYTCHTTDYQKSVNPPHLAGGFATTCSTCHRFSDAAWKPSIFNHATATPFPLVGLHATQTCARCHTTMPYKSAPMTCVGCHLTDYNNAKTPINHITAGFPTTCETCHKATDANWLLGTFNHTRFPLTSNHNRPCADCHTTPSVFTIFTCTNCHTKSTTDSKHQGRTGYIWTSQACYSCHPNGRS